MAIQSFSVGQVLTAAQVNALQANDYNQTVSNKTGSYTLVAADKGTRITMSSTSATTITVNTNLFSAGDTLFIQNLNIGVSTITAGTATVTTASSLALAQWEGGTLYFTSASAAIFFKSDGAAAASGGGMTLISTTSLTGASVTLSSIPQTYIDLKIYIRQFLPATDDALLRLRFNGDSTANRYKNLEFANGNNWNIAYNADTFEFGSGKGTDDTVGESLCTLEIPDYTNTVTRKMTFGFVTFISATTTANFNHNTIQSYYSQTGAISSLVFAPSTGNFTSGTLLLYGVK